MADFILCFNTSTIRPQPLLEKIRIAGKTGWQAIELWFDDVSNFCQQGGSLAQIKNALAEHGLRVATMIALKGWADGGEEIIWDTQEPASLDRIERVMELEEAWGECDRRLELAAELGAKFVIASPPREQADLGRMAERYRELLELGGQYGVRPAMEFLGFVQSCYRVEHAWEIVQRSGRDDATLVLDPFHIFRGGGAIEDIAPVPAEKIAIVHFNDVVAGIPREQQTDSDRVMPGDGVFDLARFVRVLRDKGYQGCISLELFNPVLWQQDPSEVSRLGLEKVRKMLQD